MPTIITTPTPNEKGSATIVAAFTDENGDTMTPVSLTWTLTDTSGNIIHNRDAVVITPDTSVDIVLDGDDLAIPVSNDLDRVITIEGTYNSSYGTGLHLKDQVTFSINNLVAVS